MTDISGTNYTVANASYLGELLPYGYRPTSGLYGGSLGTLGKVGSSGDQEDYYSLVIPNGVNQIQVTVDGDPGGNDTTNFIGSEIIQGGSYSSGFRGTFFNYGDGPIDIDYPTFRQNAAAQNYQVGFTSVSEVFNVNPGTVIIGVAGNASDAQAGSLPVGYSVGVEPWSYLTNQPSSGSTTPTNPGGSGTGGTGTGGNGGLGTGGTGTGGNGGAGLGGSGTGGNGVQPGGSPQAGHPFVPFTGHQNDLSYSSTAVSGAHIIDSANFEASFPDLIQAFGADQNAVVNWYSQHEPSEQRVETFDGLDYAASYRDLTQAFRSSGSLKQVQDAAALHFVNNGFNEGRTTSFNGLDYIASYADLSHALGADNDAGAYHYIEHGSLEGRTATFDGLDYIASYRDLITGLGANEQAGAAHYITHGVNENRSTTFDGLSYIAQNADLMNAFGANNDAGATHYIQHGSNEGRATTFNVAAYEQAHTDLIGRYSNADAFLTDYINTYKSTGHFLT